MSHRSPRDKADVAVSKGVLAQQVEIPTAALCISGGGGGGGGGGIPSIPSKVYHVECVGGELDGDDFLDIL